MVSGDIDDGVWNWIFRVSAFSHRNISGFTSGDCSAIGTKEMSSTFATKCPNTNFLPVSDAITGVEVTTFSSVALNGVFTDLNSFDLSISLLGFDVDAMKSQAYLNELFIILRKRCFMLRRTTQVKQQVNPFDFFGFT